MDPADPKGKGIQHRGPPHGQGKHWRKRPPPAPRRDREATTLTQRDRGGPADGGDANPVMIVDRNGVPHVWEAHEGPRKKKWKGNRRKKRSEEVPSLSALRKENAAKARRFYRKEGARSFPETPGIPKTHPRAPENTTQALMRYSKLVASPPSDIPPMPGSPPAEKISQWTSGYEDLDEDASPFNLDVFGTFEGKIRKTAVTPDLRRSSESSDESGEESGESEGESESDGVEDFELVSGSPPEGHEGATTEDPSTVSKMQTLLEERQELLRRLAVVERALHEAKRFKEEGREERGSEEGQLASNLGWTHGACATWLRQAPGGTCPAP
eukprot:jgi/Mesvir1/19316/Mv10382-RA.1